MTIDQPNENVSPLRVPVALPFCYFFFVIFCYYLIKPLREGTLLERFPSSSLPYFNLCSLIGVILLGGFYNLIHRRFGRVAFVLLLNGIQFFLMSLFALVFHFEFYRSTDEIVSTSIIGSFYVWLNSFNLFTVSLCWSLINEYWNVLEAKKQYGLVGAGGCAGGIAAGLFAEFLYRFIAPREMLLVCLPFFIGSCLFPVMIIRFGQRNVNATVGRRQDARSLSAMLVELLGLLKGRYITWLALILLIKVLAGTIVQYEYYSFLQAQIDRGLYTQINNTLMLSINLIAFATSILLTPRLLRANAISASLASLPILAMIVSLFLFLDIFAIVLLGGVFLTAVTYSLDRSASELLYVPTSIAEKYRAKSFIDMIVYRIGTLLGSIAIIVANNIGSPGPIFFCVKILLTVAWLYLVFRIVRLYTELQKEIKPPTYSGRDIDEVLKM